VSAPPYFFAPQLGDAPGELTLEGDEARHARSARRLSAGEAVAVFDGRGGVGLGRVALSERHGPLVLQIDHLSREPRPRPLVLASALPKGDRLSVLLDMATQLGMTRFVPLICERSVVVPAERGRARWERVCMEACKQSRRAWLPALDAPRAVERAADWLDGVPRWWAADPDGADVREAARDDSAKRDGVGLLVGPEGGFTAHELARLADCGVRPLSLGAAILRVEAAAVAGLAALSLCAAGAFRR